MVDKFEYIDSLILKCNEAKSATSSNEFILNSLDELDAFNRCIYIVNQVKGSIDEVFNKFKSFRAETQRSCSKLNSPSKCMYVGSSTSKNGLKKRIKQHLGKGAKQTYSLHLSEWLDESYFSITIKVFDHIEDREVIQIIEDNIAYNLSPAFGKRGSNSK